MSIGLPHVTVTIRGISPYAQAKKDSLELAAQRKAAKGAEAQDRFDLEHAKDRLTINPDTGNVAIPGFGLRMAIANAASKAGEKFKGQKTWGAKFTGGIAIFDPVIDIGVPAVIKPESEKDGVFIRAINAHANGDRKTGKRVTRYIPHVHRGWHATFDITILDEDLSSAPGRVQVERAVRDAGILVGIGQHRPENYGSNGRFEVLSFKWAA